MKLDEIKSRTLEASRRLPRIDGVRYDPARWAEEVRAEIADLEAAALPAEALIEGLATLWVHYQVLHHALEEQHRVVVELQALVVEDVADRSRNGRTAAEASGAATRNPAWASRAAAIWAEHPHYTLNKVGGMIASEFSRPHYTVHKSSVMRSIEPLVPKSSPSYGRR